MKILINVKQLGKKIASVEPVEFKLDCEPHTVGELICAAVRTCVRDYNSRIEHNEFGKPVDIEKESAMTKIGKISFGLTFSDKKADIEKSQQIALEAYHDGLFRLFIGEYEPSDENEKIELTEHSNVTFIRLAMLAGRMW